MNERSPQDKAVVAIACALAALLCLPAAAVAAVGAWALRKQSGGKEVALAAAVIGGLLLFRTYPLLLADLAGVQAALVLIPGRLLRFAPGAVLPSLDLAVFGRLAAASWQLWVVSLPLAGPLLLIGLLMWQQHDDKASGADVERAQRLAGEQARAAAARVPPVVGQPPLPAVGTVLRGTRFNQGGRLVIPFEQINRHAIVFGGSGVGKSEAVIRSCYSMALAYPNLHIVYIDGKDSPRTATRFKAAMRKAGRDVAMFPDSPYDIWRGSDQDVQNKLVSSLDFSRTLPFHRNAAYQTTRLALGTDPGRVRSSTVFMERMSEAALLKAYEKNPAELAKVKYLKAENLIGGVVLAYDVLFSTIGTLMDGRWAFEDVATAYIRLDGLNQREQSEVLGRLFLQDLKYVQRVRGAAPRRMLLVIDEFALLVDADEAVQIFQQMRDIGDENEERETGIIAMTQTYADLGGQAKKIVGAGGLTIAFSMADPEEVAKRGGYMTRRQTAISRTTRGQALFAAGEHATTVTTHEEDRLRLPWDDILQLDIGQAAIIGNGFVTIGQFGRAPLSEAELALARQPVLRLPVSQAVTREEVDPDAETTAAALDPTPEQQPKRRRKVRFED